MEPLITTVLWLAVRCTNYLRCVYDATIGPEVTRALAFEAEAVLVSMHPAA